MSEPLLNGNTAIAQKQLRFLSLDGAFPCICLPRCECECSPVSVCCTVISTSSLKGRSPAYHLPSCCSSASKMSPRSVCFLNWPLLMKPSVEFKPVQHCRSQMCQVILKPHKNSAYITVQIAGNYVFASPGKYAQISLHNWSPLKIKAARVFTHLCLFFS